MPIQSFTRSLAVVIGIDAYGPGIPRLTTAVNDATRLCELLHAGHGYETILLTQDRIGQPVTKERIGAVFTQSLPARLGPDDRLLVYFAGHGVALDGDDGPAGFIMPQDARPDDRATFLSMKNLHAWLTALPCRHMLAILDCCFAGAFRWAATRDVRLPQVLHKERFDRYVRSPAWQVITSASYDQRALDVLTGSAANSVGTRGERGRQHSPFAQTLFDALNGAADLVPAGGGDGVITASELALYLRETVEMAAAQKVNFEQTPQLWSLDKHRKGEYIFLTPGRLVKLPRAEALTERNNPYRGLQPYEREHGPLFFGRREEIAALVKRVDGQPCVVVLGASGTGKSSLVKAGVLPHLERAGRVWQVLPPIRPTEHPVQALAGLLHANLPGVGFRLDAEGGLAAAIASWRVANPGRRLVLTVDQCEELVTLCRDERKRNQFLGLLAAAVRQHPDAFHLVMTLRSDFEPQLAGSPLFGGPGPRLERYVIPPMDQDALRDVIEGPAGVRELYFEPPELVDDLINEVVQMPGGLPLLSFTLSEMYVRYVRSGRDDRALTRADYQAVGGVIGSLRQRANAEYEGLPDDAHRATMERVMLRMIAAEGGGELARRRVALSELDYPTDAENGRVKTVLDRLVDARLVVRGTSEHPDGSEGERASHGEAYAEPAHDALVLAWDRLLRWKQAAEEYLPLQRRVAQAALDWSRAKPGDKDGLLWNDDPRLAQLERILAPASQAQAGAGLPARARRMLWPDVSAPADTAWLNRLEVAFTQASVARRAAVLKRVVAITAAVIVVLTALAVFAALQANVATVQRNEANVQRNIAQTREVDAVNEANLRSTEVAVRSTAQANEAAARQIAQTREVEAQAAATAEAQARQRAEEQRLQAQRQALASGAQSAYYRQDTALDLPLAIASLALQPDNPPNELTPIFYAAASSYARRVIRDETGGSSRSAALPYQVRMVVAPDGKTALTGTYTGPVHWWDLHSGQMIKAFEGHEKPVLGVAFDADGKTVVSWSADSTLRRWDMTSGRLLQTVQGPAEMLSDGFSAMTIAVLSPDGKTVLSNGLLDGAAALWDANTGQLLRTLESGSGAMDVVYALAFSPDGETVLAGSGNGPIWQWDVSTGDLMQTLSGHTAGASALAFSPNGQRLLSGSYDETLRLWDLSTGQAVLELPRQGARVLSAAFSPDERMLVAGSNRGAIRLLDAATGQRLGDLVGESGPVNQVAFSADNSQVVSFSDQTLRLWDVPMAKPVRTFSANGEQVRGVAFSPDGSTVLSGGTDKLLHLWDVATGEELRTFQGHTGGVEAMAISPDGTTVLSGSDDKSLRLWDLETARTLRTLNGHDGVVMSVAFSPDGKTALSGSYDGTLRLWDLATGETSRVFVGHKDIIMAVALSAEGLQALSTSYDGTIRLWDVASGRLLRIFAGRVDYMRGVALSPDGSIAATAGGTADLWDVATGQRLRSLVNASALKTAFSPDGRTVLTAGGAVELWDVATGALLRQYSLSSPALSLAISANGGTAITGSEDGTLSVWQTDTLSDLIPWVRANRYVPELPCEVRERYGMPPCVGATETPVAAP